MLIYGKMSDPTAQRSPQVNQIHSFLAKYNRRF